MNELKEHMTQNTDLYIRNIIFGITDSLVSTVGLLSGIDTTGTTSHVIIMTGIIYAFVEAFSMAVGSFLSEQSVEEYAAGGEVNSSRSLLSAIVMFIAFVLAAFIPILPYMFFSFTMAFVFSIIFSLAALFVVGLISARMSKISMFKHSFRVILLGGMAIIIGVVVGKFVRAA